MAVDVTTGPCGGAGGVGTTTSWTICRCRRDRARVFVAGERVVLDAMATPSIEGCAADGVLDSHGLRSVAALRRALQSIIQDWTGE
jgi:hypothetical protein